MGLAASGCLGCSCSCSEDGICELRERKELMPSELRTAVYDKGAESSSVNDALHPRFVDGPLSPRVVLDGTAGLEEDERLIIRSQARHGTGSTVLGEQSDEVKKPKYQKKLTRMAAGHGGMSILKDFDEEDEAPGGIPSHIIKIYDEKEAASYRALEESKDELLRFTPRWEGEVNIDEDNDDGVAGHYMRLTNLLKNFSRGPHVMDCKLGFRSFGEDEVTKTTLRPDLYQRLIALDPSAATEEERKAEACTKHKWMTFNDSYTSLATNGFRIDGIAFSGGDGQVPKKTLKETKTLEKAARCIVDFFLPVAFAPRVTMMEDKPQRPSIQTLDLRLAVAKALLAQLEDMRQVMHASPFVRNHVFVGSSLLFVADANGPDSGVFLIDFAKICPLPDGVKIDHRKPWSKGNYEDGLFTGMDNMISCFEIVIKLVTEAKKAAEDA